MTAKSTSSAGADMPEVAQSIAAKPKRRAPKLWESLGPNMDGPTPRPGESEGEFMGRCVPALSSAPMSHEERTAACSIAWRRSAKVREAVVVTWQEAVATPPGRPSLDIPREVMPQIPHGKLKGYISWLQAQGVEVETTLMAADALLPTQGEVDPEKVEKIRTEGSWRGIPLVVAGEGRILDGLHRWSAAMAEDPQSPLPVVVVRLPIAELVLLTHSWPGVERRDLADRSA